MSPGHPEIIVTEFKDDEFEEFLKNHIREHNNRSSELFRRVRKGPKAPKPLNIRMVGHDGETVGGLTASTYWGWMDIEDFYIPEQLRGKGFGAEILSRAEEIARTRGCTAAQLTTYEFQARIFYEKQGWRVVGTLEGYPPGSAYHWMRKDFT